MRGTGKTVLICHHDAPLDRGGLASWLTTFTELAGLVIIREPKARLRKRIAREVNRVGVLRFCDVLLFQLYYRVFLASSDGMWQEATLRNLEKRYGELPSDIPLVETSSPNSPESEAFLKSVEPDLIIARCKSILNKRIFTKARVGTFVMHPGICPAYRNAHGCFWALANRDTGNVGMTLLKIDEGVDTGPVYGFYRYDYNELTESHVVIQNRVVLENLDSLQAKLTEILTGKAATIDTRGSKSQTWGQPWLSKYLRWKRAAREEHLKDRNNIV